MTTTGKELLVRALRVATASCDDEQESAAIDSTKKNVTGKSIMHAATPRQQNRTERRVPNLRKLGSLDEQLSETPRSRRGREFLEVPPLGGCLRSLLRQASIASRTLRFAPRRRDSLACASCLDFHCSAYTYQHEAQASESGKPSIVRENV